MSGPCVRSPLPGDEDYPEHVARLIGKQIERMTSGDATSSPIELGRAIVRMSTVRLLIDEAGQRRAIDELTDALNLKAGAADIARRLEEDT